MNLRGAAPAAERNKGAIAAALQPYLVAVRSVLEVGSGVGQHAVHLCAACPWLRWQCTELAPRLADLSANCAAAGLAAPLLLDVARQPWPVQGPVDVVYSANTLHIMDTDSGQALLAGAAAVLADGGVLAVYGPFGRGGRFAADSNARFDASLRAADPHQGVRDLDQVEAGARSVGLLLQADVPMPANNQLIIWRKFGAD